MQKVFYYLILFLALTSGCIKSSSKEKVCSCCTMTFTSIDSAGICILQTPIQGSDPRLFLIVFVRKDLNANQKAGWDLIKDQEIINVAKQNYLLITLDPQQFEISQGQVAPELIERIKRHKEDIFFVIANQALYPFGDWAINEKKNIIIDNLRLGNGP